MTTLDGAVDLARDRELVEQCQAGDEAAFAELYTRYHRRLHRFCLRRVHNPDDADEAVQEAFARAWRALPRFAGERRFYPWLTVIAANVCTDLLRRRSRVVPMDEMPWRRADAETAGVDDGLMRGVDVAMATRALGNLSERHQRVLQLREATEWSAQQIAEHEGLAVPAVDTLLWRARQAFKREFSALSDAGGLAGIAALGLATLRRTLGRAGARVASWVPSPVRAPGALATALAIGGAAIVGGGAALVVSARTQAPHPAGARTPLAPATSSAGVGDRSPSGADRTSGTASTPGAGRTTGGAPGASGTSGTSGTTVATLPGSSPLTTPARTPLGRILSGLGGATGGSTTGGSTAQGTSGILPSLTTPLLTTPPLTTPSLTTPALTSLTATTPLLTVPTGSGAATATAATASSALP